MIVSTSYTATPLLLKLRTYLNLWAPKLILEGSKRMRKNRRIRFNCLYLTKSSVEFEKIEITLQQNFQELAFIRILYLAQHNFWCTLASSYCWSRKPQIFLRTRRTKYVNDFTRMAFSVWIFGSISYTKCSIYLMTCKSIKTTSYKQWCKVGLNKPRFISKGIKHRLMRSLDMLSSLNVFLKLNFSHRLLNFV